MYTRLTRRLRQSGWACVLLFAGLAAGVAPVVVGQEVPSVKLQTGALVSPNNWWNGYPNPTTVTHTVGVAVPASTPPEIVELANALSGRGSYSAATFLTTAFEYVRNNITVEFRFGLGKGALGALVDQSGTPLDQAYLLAALIKYANSQWPYNLSVSFQAGTVSLTGAQFQTWSGFTNALAGCQFLADGGIPATVNGAASCASLASSATVSTVVMGQVWLVVNSQIYDPGLKIHTVKVGGDLSGALGCGPATAPTCGTGVLSSVPAPTQVRTAGASQIQGVNQTALEATLKGYATNLQNSIRARMRLVSNSPNVNFQVEDYVGGLIIDTSQPVAAGTSVPATAYSPVTTAWSDIPDQLRTSLTVQFAGINQLVYADETGGRRLRIVSHTTNGTFTNVTLISTLYVEYRPIASNYPTGLTGQNGVPIPVTLVVAHPYAQGPAYLGETLQFNAPVVLNWCGSIGLGCSDTNWWTSVITIVQGWGDATESSVTQAAAIAQRDETDMPVENPTDPRHTWSVYHPAGGHVPNSCQSASPPQGAFSGTSGCFETSQGSLAASWLEQASRATHLAAGVNGSAAQLHHSIGIIVSGLANAGSTLISVQTSLSANSLTASASDRASAFFGVATVLSRLEGAVIEQQGDIWEGGSAVSMMTKSNANSFPFYDAPNTTALNDLITNGNLSTYTNFAQSLFTSYTQAGFDIVLPQNSEAGQFCNGPTCVTYGYSGVAAYKSSSDRIAFLTGVYGGLKGAAGASDPVDLVTQQTTVRDYAAKDRKALAVNLASGGAALSLAPDLVTGMGEFPYSLAFRRIYDSSSVAFSCAPGSSICSRAETEVSGLPLGWTHTLAITARLTNDGMASFGRNSALDASSVLAALYTARTLNTGTRSFQSNVATIFVINWLGKQLSGNVVAVRKPPDRLAFVRLPDGSFDPQPNSADHLTQSGLQTFDGLGYWDNSALSFSLVDRGGSTLAFSFKAMSTFMGAAAYSRTLYLPTTWTFPTGIQLSFAYLSTGVGKDQVPCLAGVSNNLGRSLTFQNTCAASTATPATVLPLIVSDEAGNRSVTIQPLPASTLWGRDTGLTGFQVTAADGQSTSEFDYVPFPTAHINRTYYYLASWTPALEKASGGAPYLTISYDSLFRVNATTDNSLPHPFTTQYYVAGLYGTENQKRGEMQDPLGAQTTVYFDKFGHEVQNIDPLGRVTSTTYDTAWRVIRKVFPELNSEIYVYDLRSNLTQTSTAAKPGSGVTGTRTNSTYQELPQITTCVNPVTCNRKATDTDTLGNVTTYGWDPGTGLLTSIQGPADPNGVHSLTTYGYTVYTPTSPATGPTFSLLTSRIQQVDATRTRKVTYQYNPNNKYVLLNRAVNPGLLNLVTQYTFDANGNVHTVIDPRTNTTTYTFDLQRRLQGISAPMGALTRFCYDGDNELLVTGRARVLTPTDLNCASLDATQWQLEQRSYFPTGDLKSVTDPEGHITQYSYDPLGRQTQVTDPDNRRTGTVYDLAGQKLCVFTGWNGAAPPGAADCQNWNPATYVASGPVRSRASAYTANGKIGSVTDANNNSTVYIYDGMDRLQYSFFPDPATGQPCTGLPCSTGSTYEQLTYYNSSGTLCSVTFQPCSKVMRNGQSIGYTYDALDRLATRAPQGLPTASYSYTLLGESLLVSDGTHSVQHDYDGAGRALYESNDGRPVTYGYDGSGNRTQTIWPDNYTVSYVFDALNRMSDVWEGAVNSGVHLANYGYDTLSRRSGLAFSAATSANSVGYGYFEPGNRLHQLTNALNPASLVLTYGRNGSGQINSLNVSDSFYLPEPAGGAASTAYSPNRLNEYASVGGSAVSSDLNGNLRSWLPLNGSGAQTYTYDVENRLRTAATGGSASASIFYDYDPLGRRITKTVGGTAVGVGGTTTGYLLDGNEEIAEYSVSGTTWTLQRRYIVGPAIDERVAHVEGNALSGAPKTFYHVNHQGSVLAMTDATGATTQQLSYDEYGNLSSTSVATGEPYRFTGRRFDPETGLYYYRARYYSSALGRFLQTDPIGYGDDLNFYPYVGNDPLNKTDPTGKCRNPDDPDCIFEGPRRSWYRFWDKYRAIVERFKVEAGFKVEKDLLSHSGAGTQLDTKAETKVGVQADEDGFRIFAKLELPTVLKAKDTKVTAPGDFKAEVSIGTDGFKAKAEPEIDNAKVKVATPLATFQIDAKGTASVTVSAGPAYGQASYNAVGLSNALEKIDFLVDEDPDE